jgi:FKBP-type peptidyl-prolyl cis-trans isomerase
MFNQLAGCGDSRFPAGVTERKARATTKAKAATTADSLRGMTERKARATTKAKAKAKAEAEAKAKAKAKAATTADSLRGRTERKAKGNGYPAPVIISSHSLL